MSAQSTSMVNRALAFSEGRRWIYLVIVLAVGISCYADRAVLSVVLPPLKEEFRLSDTTLGLLTGPPFALCYALASIPLGRLADATSRKLVLACALAVWTVMTGLCGFATSLTMLILFRMGVGASEGSAVPSGHALLADYFPPERRTVAFAAFAAAPALGTALATGLGGWLADNHGWRSAFWGTAILGVPVLLAAAVVLKEPPRPVRTADTKPRENFRGGLRTLLAKPSFRLIVAGSVMIAAFTQGALMFAPTLMVRTFSVSLTQTGLSYGLATLVGSVAGMLAGGVVGNHLSKRSVSLLFMLPAVGPFVAGAFAFVAFTTSSSVVFVIMSTCIQTVLTGLLPAIYTGIQHVCGGNRRALADALNMAAVNAFGIALGPVMAGLISELNAAAGADSLRISMLTMTVVLPISGLLFFAASRRIERDAE